MKLLLAEDEVELSNALTAILKHSGYTVDAVYDGQDALDYALIGGYDGLVLDIMMPRLDGWEVLKRVRAKGISTPALFLTAKRRPRTRSAASTSAPTTISRSPSRWASSLRGSAP